MYKIEKEIQVRWSDIDPNFHVRHSVYYDWGAMFRIEFFVNNGLSLEVMNEHHIGPVLFREEAIFKKEILMDDVLKIDIQITKAKRDFSRWSIRHVLIKNDGVVAAIIHVDGAWINTIKRKLAEPNVLFEKALEKIPPTEDFQWID